MLNGQRKLPPEEAIATIANLEGQIEPTEVLRSHLALMETIGGSPLVTGNKATLLIDGDVTFAAMLKTIEEARDHINFETYIIKDDDVGRRFADLLLKKRAEGIVINLIYDGFGCRGTPRSFFRRLQKGGINTVEFNPMTLTRFLRGCPVHHRTHRKVLVVDGSVAFTGGINIGNVYLKSRSRRDTSSPPEEFWRDTHVMIEGPVVAEFQKLFLATWSHQGGPPLSSGNYFPEVGRMGDQIVQVVGSTPGYMNRTTYIMYVSAVAHATRSIRMTQSYFAPDDQMMQALTDAAKRGVDVQIILPEYTDHAIVRQAGRWHYGELLKAGVKLYERSGTVLHSKSMVVDGIWSTIGSTNLELWSFVSNDEINAVILSREFAKKMESSFEEDVAESNRILPEEWAQRPLIERTKQFIFNLFNYWM